MKLKIPVPAETVCNSIAQQNVYNTTKERRQQPGYNKKRWATSYHFIFNLTIEKAYLEFMYCNTVAEQLQCSYTLHIQPTIL